MKRIVLVRHAKPESAAPVGDAERPLSDEGRRIHKKVSRDFRKQNILPTKILTSPLLRAKQTAEIMGDEFGGVLIQELDVLDGSHKENEIIEAISHAQDGECLFLVGHVPNMTELANKLGLEKVTDGVSKSECLVFDFSQDIAAGKGIYLGAIRP